MVKYSRQVQMYFRQGASRGTEPSSVTLGPPPVISVLLEVGSLTLNRVSYTKLSLLIKTQILM